MRSLSDEEKKLRLAGMLVCRAGNDQEALVAYEAFDYARLHVAPEVLNKAGQIMYRTVLEEELSSVLSQGDPQASALYRQLKQTIAKRDAMGPYPAAEHPEETAALTREIQRFETELEGIRLDYILAHVREMTWRERYRISLYIILKALPNPLSHMYYNSERQFYDIFPEERP